MSLHDMYHLKKKKMNNSEALRNQLAMRRKESEPRKRMAHFMLTMTGSNVVAPASIQQPLVDECNREEETQDALITCANALAPLSTKQKMLVLKTVAFGSLKQVDILNLMEGLNDMNSEVLIYMLDHPEERADTESAVKDMLQSMGLEDEQADIL